MRTTLLLTLVLTGCFDTTQGRDRDGDGFETAELDGDDCDDTNVNINPDAAEVCGNGVDDNCDGRVDDTGAGDVEWYLDLDQDGFAGPDVMRGCERPVGAFEDLSAGSDCDDADPAVNPSATETWYDGVDQDCSGGSDDDADGDGFLAVIRGGDDCDDGRADVNPGMTEVCNNGLDDDCSFDPSECEYRGEVVLADVTTVGLSAGDYASSHDWNGDGLDDVWIGNTDEGDGRMFFAPFSTSAATVPALFPDSSDCADNEVNGEVDYNGDGVKDLSLTCNEEGVFVFYGPQVVGSYLLSQADMVMSGSNLPTRIEGQLVAVDDRNGDDVDEVIVPLQDGYHLVLSPHGANRSLVDEPLISGSVSRLPSRVPLDATGRFPAVASDGTAVVANMIPVLSEYDWNSVAAFPQSFEDVPSWSVPTAQ